MNKTVKVQQQESLMLWIALAPKQYEDLNEGKEEIPDEYSKRFGLRCTMPTRTITSQCPTTAR